MNHKRILTYILVPIIVFETVLILVSFKREGFLVDILSNGLDYLNDSFVESVGFMLLGIIPVLIILLFTHKKTFITWTKFAIPYIILSAILLISYDDRGGSWGVGDPDREGVSMILAGLFFIISILIIAIKSWTLRKEKKNT